MVRPYVGATVVYCPGDLQHDRQTWHAAIITLVHSDECLDLIVAFSDGTTGVRRRSVMPSDRPDRAGWRWPTPE